MLGPQFTDALSETRYSHDDQIKAISSTITTELMAMAAEDGCAPPGPSTATAQVTTAEDGAERGRERATHTHTQGREYEGERERLKPHNALHAAGLKSCRFISSCLWGSCVSVHTLIHSVRAHTDSQAERSAFFR
ncbi:hypothetical protein JOB18_023351 [Solea senegalensis]|uniref:Uncharacterized protein n=1 Tax=Solea senegalensis TaxID=28829 RepID=A0AAV6PWI1_SOLSE|nr:hypothetical protein JOB18_023351 [Solea senegalensis]